jgi:hypothetical protein
MIYSSKQSKKSFKKPKSCVTSVIPLQLKSRDFRFSKFPSLINNSNSTVKKLLLKVEHLPTGTTRFFAREFGFSANETAALLGAHTLGRALPSNSGFKVLVFHAYLPTLVVY